MIMEESEHARLGVPLYQTDGNVYVIPDIHGDILRFTELLIQLKIIKMSRTLDEKPVIHWTAPPRTIVVQLGDQLDSLDRRPSGGRGTSNDWDIGDLKVVELCYFLNILAKDTNGSRFINLYGNHEYENLHGNFSYVSGRCKEIYGDGRRERFQPGSEYLKKYFSDRHVACVVNDILFSHAGIKIEHVDKVKIAEMELTMLVEEGIRLSEDTRNGVLGKEGCLWTRFYTPDNFRSADAHASYVNRLLGTKLLVIGHNVNESSSNIYISPGVNYIVADTGLSRVFGKKEIEVIIFTPQMNIIKKHIFF
jgi:hypothetical protein